MSDRPRTASAWALPVGLTIVVLGLVALALTRGPETLNPDSAEGTVQEYLVALDEGRYEDALEVLHPQWNEICDADALRQLGIEDFTARLGHVNSNSFGDVGIVSEEFREFRPDLPAGTEFVDVTITRNSGPGFGGGGWDEYVVFELVDEDGFYWIVGDPWPYFTWNCSGDL